MYGNKQRRVTTGIVRVSSDSKWPTAWPGWSLRERIRQNAGRGPLRHALWLGLAALVILAAALVFSGWYVALIGWQLDRFGWYLPTATPVLLVLVPVAIVLGLTWRLLTRAAPAEAVGPPNPADLARRLARALAALAALTGGVALIIAWYAWRAPDEARAWPRQTLAAVEAGGITGPVDITDAAPDADPTWRMAVLREDNPAFAGETPYVLLRHADGTPSRILAEVVPDPQAPGRRVIRRGYLVARALPDPVLARLSRDLRVDGTKGPILVLWAKPHAIRRVAMVAAIQALAFALVLTLAACVMARRVTALKRRAPTP
jgi:hypothetical protein